MEPGIIQMKFESQEQLKSILLNGKRWKLLCLIDLMGIKFIIHCSTQLHSIGKDKVQSYLE